MKDPADLIPELKEWNKGRGVSYIINVLTLHGAMQPSSAGSSEQALYAKTRALSPKRVV